VAGGTNTSREARNRRPTSGFVSPMARLRLRSSQHDEPCNDSCKSFLRNRLRTWEGVEGLSNIDPRDKTTVQEAMIMALGAVGKREV
jgi:hypothetical protein